MNIEEMCCTETRDKKYKLEKPQITVEDIDNLTLDEKKWLMALLIMSMDENSFKKCFAETDIEAVFKRIFNPV